MQYTEVICRFPKIRPELPKEYKEIWNQHYLENRNGSTKVTKASSWMERWLHKKVARTASKELITLEIGAGTLNQLQFEKTRIYDVIEPQHMLYENSNRIGMVRYFFDDISEVEGENQYDRIISVATFEHICNLPEVVEKSVYLLKDDGILCVSIPNEGRFLWHFAYTFTTGLEFKKKYGLDYEIWMRHEHVNSADEIEIILKHYFGEVKASYCGIGKNFSLYRSFECRNPRKSLS